MVEDEETEGEEGGNNSGIGEIIRSNNSIISITFTTIKVVAT
jgi:hypothetical protein